MTDIVALQLYYPDLGWDAENDYKFIKQVSHDSVAVRAPNGELLVLTGPLHVGATGTASVVSSGRWHTKDPQCQHSESWHRGHPEDPSRVPTCFHYRVHAHRGVNPWQHKEKERLKRRIHDELESRKRRH